ncbi:hypothetical protein H072_4825 [Dactylellina haptotyla CBS 200.50]|uniref:RCC1-like domain-containing protein n=1 Tax=Dactylellina haptotyla (strain CBS 200.50) TaxID=1284197 RepID=S8C0S2_DACHA|nr:hypothetical protein H072_4825 [Dactylellina haptotyla CBS 200.50]
MNSPGAIPSEAAHSSIETSDAIPCSSASLNLPQEVQLFSFGSNSLGQLSIGHIEDAHTPTKVLLPPSTSLSNISIITGGNHTFLLSYKDETLYSVGDNTFGQCATLPTSLDGQQSQRIKTAFTTVPSPTSTSHWISVSAGWQFSLLLSSEDKLYACGNGPRGELGLGASTVISTSPVPIPSFPPPSTTIIQIASCVEHTLARISDGSIYGWGNGRKGQLGTLPAGEKYIWSPLKLQIENPAGFEVAGIATGREFSALISREGEVYVMGNDKWGVIKLNPLTKNPGWKSFGAGWGAVYVLTAEGSIISWGRGTHGQLPPDGMPELDKIAVGSEHGIGVGRDGKLYAWGWGEHGNCGPLVEEQGEVVRWKHELAINGLNTSQYRIEGIAAGCATSWVWITRAV